MNRYHVNVSTVVIMVALIVCLQFVIPTMVLADMGPKPDLKIYVENPPEEVYYLDLLTRETGEYSNWGNEDEAKTYNQEMIQALYSAEKEGWYPALTEGTPTPMWGKLIGEAEGDKMLHEFGYVGLPEQYRIIIVTESGKVTISEEFERKVLQSTITYNYETNMAEIPSLAKAYGFQFISTCIPTLLIEILLLFLFRFKGMSNLAVVVITNIGTQVILMFSMGSMLIEKGTLAGFLVQFPVELFIIGIESLVYVRFLKGFTSRRRVAYAMLANLVSWGVGYLLMFWQYEVIGTLI